MESREWEKRVYSLDYLWLRATLNRTSMVSWLRDAGVIPKTADHRRRNAIPKTIDEFAIPAGYLAEVALSWDDDGLTTPVEFLTMLQAEVAGSPQHRAISETLEGLGKEANDTA